MRPPALAVALFLAFPVVAAPQTIQRDPQAVARMLQMLAATGWTPTAIPATVLASGTFTRFNGSSQQIESFTIKQRGPAQHRLTLQHSSLTATTVVNGLAGAILFSDKTKHRLPGHAAMSFQSPAFPFFSDLAQITDLSIEVRDLGTATIDGTACYGTYVARHAPTSDKMARFRDLAAPLKVWTSVQSSFPVRIDFIRLSDDNPYLRVNFPYSNYRVINGVAVAFQQDERFANQLISRAPTPGCLCRIHPTVIGSCVDNSPLLL